LMRLCEKWSVKRWFNVKCDSQDLTLRAVLSDADNTVQVDPGGGANKQRKLVLTPVLTPVTTAMVQSIACPVFGDLI
jgi:hypothetical protein